MGQITIEVPQKIRRKYRIADRDSAEKFLSDLEESKVLAKSEKLSAEDAEDLREAIAARAEFERTGESYTIAELRAEFEI